MGTKHNINKLYTSLFAILFLFASMAGNVSAGSKKEVQKQESWKEIFIDNAYEYTWCGNNKLLLSGGGKNYRLIDIHTKNIEQLPIEPPYYGCSPDERYIFSSKTTHCKGLAVYDTKTKQVQCLLNTKYAPTISGSGATAFFSPDGKYFAWNSEEKIQLPGGEYLTLIPVFKNMKNIMQKGGFEDIVWSPDSKKIILLISETPPEYPFDSRITQHIAIYDILSNKVSIFKLKLMNKFYGKSIKISPDGNSLYIQAILDEDTGNDLYVLDLTKLDLAKLVAKPKVIMNDILSFDISSDNLIVLQIESSTNTYSKYPAKDDGLYLSDHNFRMIKKFTPKTIDGGVPVFSNNGRAIAYFRASGKSMSPSVYILLKEKK